MTDTWLGSAASPIALSGIQLINHRKDRTQKKKF